MAKIDTLFLKNHTLNGAAHIYITHIMEYPSSRASLLLEYDKSPNKKRLKKKFMTNSIMSESEFECFTFDIKLSDRNYVHIWGCYYRQTWSQV